MPTSTQRILLLLAMTALAKRWASLVVLTALLIGSPIAHAARQALVIGNAAYTEGALKNPVNDARAIDAKLTALGFKVMKVENLKRQQIGRTLSAFANGLKPGDEVVVFYAGHGVQVKGINYLPAVDADIQSEEDVALNSLNLNSLMERLDEAKAGLKLLFLDACRNNPYARSMRSGDRGLARISAAPSGTLIHFATRPGSVAADGSGSNGLYTTQLLRFIDSADIPVETMLKRVSAAVTVESKRQQEPWTEGSIIGEFYFRSGGAAQTANPEPVAASPRPGQVAGLSLADLEREESTRKEWAAWQAKMKVDFDKTAQFTGGADLQVKAWERFLAAWAQDNPQSQEDEGLREQAQSRLAGVRQAALQPARPVAQNISVTAGQTIKDCADCPEMVIIPAGSFEMGSPESEKDRWPDGSEGPVHKVSIDYTFALGKHELTRAEFARFVNASGYKSEAERSQGCYAWAGKAWAYDASKNWRNPGFDQADSHPVVCVSWNDAQAYLAWLNQKVPGKAFRLPSEAEWEYAARAGQGAKRFPWGDDQNYSQICSFANSMDATGKAKVPGVTWTAASCSDGYAYTAPSGSFKPNAFGLYDMHGNAFEWVQDVYHENYQGAPADGSAWVSGGEQARRVLRGGAWNSFPRGLRSAIRNHDAPDDRGNFTGLRIARTL